MYLSEYNISALKKARAFLRRHKWVRGAYQVDGAYCAVGAIRQVLFDDPRNKDNYYGVVDIADVIADYMRSCTPNNIPVTSFNDAFAKSKQDVIDLFTCAIEKAESESA